MFWLVEIPKFGPFKSNLSKATALESKEATDNFQVFRLPKLSHPHLQKLYKNVAPQARWREEKITSKKMKKKKKRKKCFGKTREQKKGEVRFHTQNHYDRIQIMILCLIGCNVSEPIQIYYFYDMYPYINACNS